jgi:phage tail-like protein
MRRADLETLLPGVLRTTAQPASPLDGLLAAMEVLHAPAESALMSIGDHLHPAHCPDRFVPYLASWVDLDRFLSVDHSGTRTLSSGVGNLRQLVAAAARLARRRGTAAGLVELLEIATGVVGFRVDEDVRAADARRRDFVIRLHVPLAAAPHRALVQRIVDSEKPAYVRCEIAVESASMPGPPRAAPASPATTEPPAPAAVPPPPSRTVRPS